MMHHVFLSYSRRDSDFMERIRDYLREGGLKVWTDEALEAGTESWKSAIQEAIENSNTIVVILSPDSKKSIWVQRELDYASTQGRRIYPVMVRGNDAISVPFLLASAQYADVRSDLDSGMKQLQKAIHNFVNVPLPMPPPPPDDTQVPTSPSPSTPTTTPSKVDETPSLAEQQLVMTRPSRILVLLRKVLPYVLLVGLCILGNLTYGGFFSSRNILNIVNSSLTIAVLALAATALLIIRSIDMSAGAILAASALAFSLVAQTSEEDFALFISGIIVAIVVALVITFVHGVFTRALRNSLALSNSDDIRFATLLFVSPSVLVTSLTAPIIINIVFAVSTINQGTILVNTPLSIGGTTLSWLPVSVVLLFLISEFLVRRPNIREQIDQLRSSLTLMGKEKNSASRWFLLAFLGAGVLVAVGGVLIIVRLRSYFVGFDGTSWQYAALAAVFLGGSSIFSERITFFGSLIGVAVIGVLSNVIALLNYPGYMTQLSTVLLLVLALILDFYTTPRPKLVRIDDSTSSVSARSFAR